MRIRAGRERERTNALLPALIRMPAQEATNYEDTYCEICGRASLMANGRHSYVRFFPSDWVGGTARLPRLHRSVYFDVCCYIWDTAQTVPARELRLMIADLPNGEEIVADLIEIGKLERLDDGSVTNAKAMAEAEWALAQWEKRSFGGKGGRGKEEQSSEHSCCDSSEQSSKTDGTVIASYNQNQNQNQNQILPKGNKLIFVCPPDVYEETWQAYLEVRKKKRSAMTQRAYGMILKALDESEGSPEETIGKSVMNGWSGVFPIKGGSNGRGGKPSGWIERG